MPLERGFCKRVRRVTPESGVDAMRATKAPAVVLVQYVEGAKERQTRRCPAPQ